MLGTVASRQWRAVSNSSRHSCLLALFSVAPLPFQDLGHVLSVFPDVVAVLDKFAAHVLFRVGRDVPQPGDAVDHVSHEVVIWA